jgi:gluconate 2-dehydrogenase gamma chain
MMTDSVIQRRNFLKGAGAIGTAAAASLSGGIAARAETQPLPPTAPAPTPAPAAPEPALTLNATEVAFIAAAVDTLIPADALSPSASDCGVAVFIDRQLAGAWGNGARLYRDGPFLKGKPEHGYQLALTPREFFRAGIEAANDWTRKTYGKELERLSAEDRQAALQAMEAGKADFAGLGSKEFFDALLAITMEGFFADPIYGGNRNKAGWKMVGYPGLPAVYNDAVEKYRGKPYRPDPQSIADFS